VILCSGEDYKSSSLKEQVAFLSVTARVNQGADCLDSCPDVMYQKGEGHQQLINPGRPHPD